MSREQIRDTGGPQPAIPSSTRLRGRWLVWYVWLAIAILSVGPFVAAVPAHFAELRSVCAQEPCDLLDQLRPEAADYLKMLGISLDVYAVASILVKVFTAFVFFAVATIIALRKSHNWAALFFSISLITVGASAGGIRFTLGEVYPAWRVPGLLIDYIQIAIMLPLLSLFPDGRFVPRWMVLFAIAWAAVQVPVVFFPESRFSLRSLAPLSRELDFVVYLGALALGLYAQLYRYWRVSGPVERQQTKWVLLGFMAFFLGILAFGIPLLIFPALGQSSSLYSLVFNLVFSFLLSSIPLSMGIAILRYRLWDIDVIINRTLVYGTLTALLAVIYGGGVVLLRQLFAPFMGGNNQIAIVASTLAIAALFSPLRRRIQFVIDRRFYRRKYDAQKTLQAFSAHLRDETDLNQLSGEIVQVVQNTLQPTHVSLWLRDGGLRSADQRSEASSSSV